MTHKFGSKNVKRVLQLLDEVKFAKYDLIQAVRMRCTYNILYATEPCTKFLQYGRDMEANTRFKFEEITTEKVIECGLVVDTEILFLAASPDIVLVNSIMYKLYQLLNYIFCFT